MNLKNSFKILFNLGDLFTDYLNSYLIKTFGSWKKITNIHDL